MAPNFVDPGTIEPAIESGLEPADSFGAVRLEEDPTEWGTSTDIDTEAIFALISQILPLEICLYHRIIPLRQTDSILRLGMVDPHDEEAKAYAGRIFSYQGFQMEPVLIAGHTHQSLLSAYLNHVGEPMVDEDDFERVEIERRELDEDEDLESAELECPESTLTPASGVGGHRTLSVETPEKVDTLVPEALQERAAVAESQPAVEQRGTLCLDVTEISALVSHHAAQAGTDDSETLGPTVSSTSASFNPTLSTSAASVRGMELPALHVAIHHLMEPLEAIAHLPAPQFLAELMGRILANGITRVLLGSAGGPGRIAWDRNGMAQLALGSIDPQVFQSLMAELKSLVGLPKASVTQSTRRVVMRSYEGQPIMIKLSIEPIGLNAMQSPQGPGEKIQMQVLRGTRLITHEQQRLHQLEKETLATAQLLQHKLKKMQIMRQTMPVLEPDFELLDQLAVVAQQNFASLPMLG